MNRIARTLHPCLGMILLTLTALACHPANDKNTANETDRLMDSIAAAIATPAIGNAAGAVLRFETNYFGYRGGNHPACYSDFHISRVKALSAGAFAIYYDGNTAEPIRNIRVKDFSVGSALHPHYLYQTRDCSFENCRINGRPLPETLPEDKERKQCDVW